MSSGLCLPLVSMVLTAATFLLQWFSPASLLGRSVPAPKEQYALESEWTFTKASEGQKLGTVALGLVNLVGVLYLSNLMAQPYVAQSLAQSSLGFMTGLLPFLQVWFPCLMPG